MGFSTKKIKPGMKTKYQALFGLAIGIPFVLVPTSIDYRMSKSKSAGKYIICYDYYDDCICVCVYGRVSMMTR